MLGVFARRRFAALQMSTRFWAHWEIWRAASPTWGGACSCRLQLNLQERKFSERVRQVSVFVSLGFSSCRSEACYRSWVC